MSAKINQIITPSNFELIRDAIGSILVLELANQQALYEAITTPTPEEQRITKVLQNTTVWQDRFVAMQDEEDFIVIPLYFQSSFDNRSNWKMDTDNQYEIDVYGHAKADKSNSTKAGFNAAQRTTVILGMIYKILMDNNYRTLGFENNPQVIRTTQMSTFKRTEVEGNDTSVGVSMYSAFFDVGSLENHGETTPSLTINELFTKVTIDETDLGYQYLVNKP